MGLRSNKRMRLIVAANRLLHRKGYDRSSIADIANEAAVPPGNAYYYFKTKDEIVEAVIERRNAYITACLADLAAIKRPAQRLVQFIDEFEKTSQPRAKFGCPIGGLCQEANRIGGAIAEQSGADSGSCSTGYGISSLRLARTRSSPRRTRSTCLRACRAQRCSRPLFAIPN